MDATVVETVRQQSLGDIPRRSARRFPDKLALIDGNTRLTFAELDQLVGRTAAALHAEGLRKGDRLVLLTHNCWQFPVISFATARLGVILVPVNFMLGPEEVAFILDHSGADAFVVEDALVGLADRALTVASTTVRVRRSIDLAGTPAATGWPDAQDWFDHSGEAPEVAVSDDDPVRIMYTSGTESRPKGVLLSSRSLMWQYVSCIVDGGMSAQDIEVHSLPLYHCAQLDCFLNVDLYLGATSVILRGPDPTLILAAITAERASKFFAPPTVWISLLRSPGFDPTLLATLTKGYYGASAMPVEILKEIQQQLPDIGLWNFYGQTELSPLATILGPDEQFSHAGSAGRAALNVETLVVDDEDRPLPTGAVGEIVHRSPHATLGYYRDEDKTAAAFRNGWFHSGDLGYLDEGGRLSVVDRKKDMIKTGGENVASREVEEVIYGLDGVAEVAVFGVDHPIWVEAVVAVVVPRQGSALEAAHVTAHVRSALAGYKTPKYVVFADSLPKNPSGKILKRQLRDAYANLAT